MSDEITNQPQVQQVVVNVTLPPKSMVTSLLLTFFFGSLGMLYSTIIGAVIMFIISVIVAILTLGFGLLVTQPICMIWGAIAVNNYNKKLISNQETVVIKS
jgi:positive regulator of sigma E activity